MELVFWGLLGFGLYRGLNSLLRRLVGGSWTTANADRWVVTLIFLGVVAGYVLIGRR